MNDLRISELKKLKEVADLGKIIGLDQAVTYLGVTALVESGGRNVLRLGPDGLPAAASGVFQFLKSTIKRFEKAFDILWSNTDVMTQARFAALHAQGDAKFAASHSRLPATTSQKYLDLIPPSGPKRTMAIMRLHYNLGPDLKRWTADYAHHNDTVKALSKFMTLLNSAGTKSPVEVIPIDPKTVTYKQVGTTQRGAPIWKEV